MSGLRTAVVALLAWLGIAFVAGVTMRVAAGQSLASWVADYTVPQLVNILAFGAAGAMLLQRRSGHLVGRLFAGSAVLQSISLLATAWIRLVPDAALSLPDTGVVTQLALLAETSLWTLAVLPVPVLLPLLLPDGRLPTTRTRPIVATGIVVPTIMFVLHLVASAPWSDAAAGLAVRDVVEGRVPRPALTDAALQAFPLLGLAVVAAVVVLARRYRAARGTERQQLRLMLVVIGLSALVTITLVPLSPSIVWVRALVALPIAVLPLGVAFAAVRYGWLDVDVVVSRTLTASLLAGFVALAYVGVVVGLGRATGLDGSDGERDALALVATALVAVAFHPVRTRLQRLADHLVYGDRATPYEVLAGYARESAGGDVLLRAARLVHDATGAERATIWRGDEVAATWPPLAAPSPRDAARALVAEIAHDGDVLGAVSLRKQRSETATAGDAALVADLAASLGVVLRNDQLVAELRRQVQELEASRNRLVDAGDEARRGIERALEVGARDRLTAVRLDIQQASAAAERAGAEQVAQLLRRLADDAEAANRSVGAFSRGVFPPLLESDGLATALAAQAGRLDTAVRVEGDPGRLPRPVEAAVYFTCLEALQNVAKYARANDVRVRLERHGDTVRFEVVDDGRGFAPAQATDGTGLHNMRDRIGAVDGHVEVESSPGRGTTVRGIVPLPLGVAS